MIAGVVFFFQSANNANFHDFKVSFDTDLGCVVGAWCMVQASSAGQNTEILVMIFTGH
jgi:uncharacterized protein YigE (DUF2233 family)